MHRGYVGGFSIPYVPDVYFAQTGQLSPSQELTQELDPQVAHLQGPVKELNSFRVLGVISSVMLVLDKNTNNTYVMKVRIGWRVRDYVYYA